MDFLSPHPAKETADLLENFLSSKGMKIFARIDQAAEAAAVGLELRPTILILLRKSQGRDSADAAVPGTGVGSSA